VALPEDPGMAALADPASWSVDPTPAVPVPLPVPVLDDAGPRPGEPAEPVESSSREPLPSRTPFAGNYPGRDDDPGGPDEGGSGWASRGWGGPSDAPDPR